ncbi:hypothetical protein IFR05_003010 [Cadophora sp. M221]|nr:hypothetical protein IFR05_003010 [Cadophora sp. M221]
MNSQGGGDARMITSNTKEIRDLRADIVKLNAELAKVNASCEEAKNELEILKRKRSGDEEAALSTQAKRRKAQSPNEKEPTKSETRGSTTTKARTIANSTRQPATLPPQSASSPSCSSTSASKNTVAKSPVAVNTQEAKKVRLAGNSKKGSPAHLNASGFSLKAKESGEKTTSSTTAADHQKGNGKEVEAPKIRLPRTTAAPVNVMTVSEILANYETGKLDVSNPKSAAVVSKAIGKRYGVKFDHDEICSIADTLKITRTRLEENWRMVHILSIREEKQTGADEQDLDEVISDVEVAVSPADQDAREHSQELEPQSVLTAKPALLPLVAPELEPENSPATATVPVQISPSASVEDPMHIDDDHQIANIPDTHDNQHSLPTAPNIEAQGGEPMIVDATEQGGIARHDAAHNQNAMDMGQISTGGNNDVDSCGPAGELDIEVSRRNWKAYWDLRALNSDTD